MGKLIWWECNVTSYIMITMTFIWILLVGTLASLIIYSCILLSTFECFKSQLNNLPKARVCQSDSHAVSICNWMTYSISIKWRLSDYFKVAQDNHLIVVCTVIKVMKDGFEFVFTPSRPLKLIMCNMQWWDSVTIIPVKVYMTVFFTFSIKSPQYTEKYREKNI